MTFVLLFCTAEEAIPFVRKALDVKSTFGDVRTFYLVESRTCPSEAHGFKQELKDGETFENDFIGASEQDCQTWALEQQSQHNFIEENIIAIADTRSASDDTLLMQFYCWKPITDFPPYGVLPRESHTWYDFRVDHRRADELYCSLKYGAEDVVYPTYFGCKEDLTDERGVFNVAEAERIVGGGDPHAP